jgi:succinylglutamate desuccinylase
MLHEMEGIPDGLLGCSARELHRVLEGPTLMHLPGRAGRPLFLSVLLHGNEDTGWEAVRELLSRQERELARPLSIFIGNVAAAKLGLRRLGGQADYNRIWSPGQSVEHAMAAQVIESMNRRDVFASIDIHNNTGRNPHYGCVNRLDHRFLHLATLFSRTVVYFIRPGTVQSKAFSALCPAVTVECGKPGRAEATAHALEFIDAVLHLDHFPDHPTPKHDYDLFHTVATVTIPEEVTFGFGRDADLQLLPDLDELNFQELPAATVMAYAHGGQGRLEARDEAGEDVTGRYFEAGDGVLRTRVPVMPSMLTTDERIIRQDCLCYLMERLPPLE